jgi:hypothetical protein
MHLSANTLNIDASQNQSHQQLAPSNSFLCQYQIDSLPNHHKDNQVFGHIENHNNRWAKK